MGNRYGEIPGDRTVVVPFNDVAANAGLDSMIFVAPFDCEVEVDIMVGANSASHTANYATLTFYNGGATGTDTASMGAFNTLSGTGGGGSLTAKTLKAITLTDDALDVGEIIVLSVAQTASGVALDSLSVLITYWPV